MPQLTDTCSEIFLSTMSVRVIQKESAQSFIRYYIVRFYKDVFNGEQFPKIEEHTLKQSPKYLKMALRKRRDAVKRCCYWGNPLSNAKKISKDNVKQVHGCQETEEYQKRTTHKSGQKITQNSSSG